MGWVRFHRQIFSHWIVPYGKRKCSTFEAWFYLVGHASHADTKFQLGSHFVELKRGQLLTSTRNLGAEFKWSRTKVDTFLKRLENEKMLIANKTTHYTVITIVNYDFYQSEIKEISHKKATGKPQKSTFKNVKNVKNKKDTTDTDDFLQEYKDVDEYE